MKRENVINTEKEVIVSDRTKTAIEKLKIISNISQNNELQQTIKVIIELVESIDEPKILGFSGDKPQS